MTIHEFPAADRDELSWHVLLQPAAFLWAFVAVAVLIYRDEELLTGHGWRTAILAVTTAGVLGLLNRLVSPMLAGLWLTQRRTGWWAPAVGQRRDRWQRANTAAQRAEEAGDEPEFIRQAALRNRIALAEPERATWISDRHASLETRVVNQYGLDFAAAWPRLRLVLPERARADLRAVTDSWRHATEAAAWGLLYTPLGLLWWPAAILGVLIFIWALTQARRATAAYTDLAEALVDLYAADLAKGLRLEPSAGPLATPMGQQMTAILRKGG